jgi:hypothetical protein
MLTGKKFKLARATLAITMVEGKRSARDERPRLDNRGVAVPIDRDVPDLSGWVAYCSTCGQDREVRRIRESAKTKGEYFEFVCTFCHSTLLTLHRRSPRGAAT